MTFYKQPQGLRSQPVDTVLNRALEQEAPTFRQAWFTMKRNSKICPICGREISLSNFKKHVDACDGQGEKIYKYKLNHDGLTCQFCGKQCKNRKGFVWNQMKELCHFIFKKILKSL